MVLILGTFTALLSISCVQSYGNIDQRIIKTVLLNCPDGQVRVNGECLDILNDTWKNNDVSKHTSNSRDVIQNDIWKNTDNSKNMITVPSNCPQGQEYVNGQCRDIWKYRDVLTWKNNDFTKSALSISSDPFYNNKEENTNTPKNIITVPPNCPPGQEFVNGQCRDVWKNNYASANSKTSDLTYNNKKEHVNTPKNIITVSPNNNGLNNIITVPSICTPAQEYIKGQCQDIWKNNNRPNNVITVPPNCPPGQEYVNGQCRNIWKNNNGPNNVITVPPNCPPGQEYVNGQCRDIWKTNNNPHNVITVPPNCPPGQEYVNGQCRDIWKTNNNPNNVITVPPNCPPGQEYVNGQCRDIWKTNNNPHNVITVPPNCPPGQEYVNGKCRDIWKTNNGPNNVISVPPNCPPGQEYVNGQCRDIWKTNNNPHNVITVPPNCPPGQEYVNGQCRDIWKTNNGPNNVITVPPNCPPGQEYVNGQCRDIWKTNNNPHNVITVPPNCPPGQEYVNGQCRDIWKTNNNPNNVITVPPNCPPGQEYVNGQCRDIWNNISPNNVITVPPNCPPEQEYINGQCRDIWKGCPSGHEYINGRCHIIWDNTEVQRNYPARQMCMNGKCSDASYKVISPNNVITVPPNCPPGQVLVNGQCRDIWLWLQNGLQFGIKSHGASIQNRFPQKCTLNQLWWNGLCLDMYQNQAMNPTGSNNIQSMCLFGEEYIKGKCIGMNSLTNELRSSKLWTSIVTKFDIFNTQRKKRQSEDVEEEPKQTEPIAIDRKIFNVPYQCPDGYRPDALGYCRPVF